MDSDSESADAGAQLREDNMGALAWLRGGALPLKRLVKKSLTGFHIIIINNQPTDKAQRPVGWNTMKIGLSSSTCPGLYGSHIVPKIDNFLENKKIICPHSNFFLTYTLKWTQIQL